MLHGTCRIIDIVVRDYDFLRKVIDIRERAELPQICFFFRHAVSDLNIILLIIFCRQKIYFLAVVIINIHLISHINKFVIDDIFKVVRKVETIIHTTDRIETNVGIVNFTVKRQFFFRPGRILLNRLYNISLFEISEIFQNGVDRAIDVLLLYIIADGIRRKNTPVTEQNEIYKIFEQTLLSDTSVCL